MIKRTKKVLIIFSLSFLAVCGLIFSQAAGIKPVQLTDNLYLISGLGGNVIFLVTEEGVLVVDSGFMSEHGRLISRAVNDITSKPIKYLVLTHYHYDHVNGCLGFSPDVLIVGHSNLVKNLSENSGPLINKMALPQYSNTIKVLEKQVKKSEAENSPQLESVKSRLDLIRNLYNELKNFKPFRPDISFNEKLVIHLGGEIVELIYPGPGHTDDGCLVYFPGKKVLHTGDHFVHRVCPFLDELAGSDIDNWIHSLRNIIDHWDVKTIIPGHGAPCGKEGLEQMLGLITELRAKVAEAVQKGWSLEQTLNLLELPSFKNLPANDLLKYDIEAVYKTLKEK